VNDVFDLEIATLFISLHSYSLSFLWQSILERQFSNNLLTGFLSFTSICQCSKGQIIDKNDKHGIQKTVTLEEIFAFMNHGKRRFTEKHEKITFNILFQNNFGNRT